MKKFVKQTVAFITFAIAFMACILIFVTTAF